MSDTYAEVKAIIVDLLGVDEARLRWMPVSAMTSKPIRSTWSS